jgi:ATP-binding cassette subfamily B protein
MAQSVFGLEMLGVSMQALGAFVTAAAGIVILWYGGYRVMAGALTVGQLLFFYSLVAYLMDPLNRLASVNLKFQDALTAVDRLYQIMDLEVEATQGRQVRFRGVRSAVAFEAVHFSYGTRRKVLDGVGLHLPAGKTVAVVGESGSGKSTLLKLLLGFYRPSAGRILIDGIDLQDYDLVSLRERVGVVAQNPFVFSKTIWANIALGRPEASLEEIIEAARLAGLDQFVAAQPERYMTQIGERGANLSGGERQRLAIARALLCQPEILIFDEATSHLDTATERIIQKNLRNALTGKTVLLVAHRLSTIKDADLIYVLHEGRVVESGAHDDLMAQNGWYAGLWRAQTDGHRQSLMPQTAAPAGVLVNGNGQTVGAPEESHA